MTVRDAHAGQRRDAKAETAMSLYMKWTILAAVGLAVGLATFLIAQSYGAASGAAVTAMVALVVVKHLGVLAAVGSPLTAFVQMMHARLHGTPDKKD
jgi:hypothetical protein